jgi:hypothetical protein
VFNLIHRDASLNLQEQNGLPLADNKVEIGAKSQLSPEDLAEEEARADGKVLNVSKARQGVESWISRHLFLWSEGQDLHEETRSAADGSP